MKCFKFGRFILRQKDITKIQCKFVASSYCILQSNNRSRSFSSSIKTPIIESSSDPLLKPEISSSEWKSSHAFYDNSVEIFAQQSLQPLTLEYLLTLGEHGSRVDSASLVQQQLPQRMARRPCKPYHLSSADFPPVIDEESERKFSEKLKELVTGHQDVIPKLAKGFQESGKYMSKESLATFLDDMIRARIGIRVLAEHHLALKDPHKDWIGVVHTRFVPFEMIRSCCVYVQDLCEINYGSAPDFSINGDTDTVVTYLPVHLEYILLELLKNAMRATVERSTRIGRKEHPSVEITICRGVEEISIRIRDQGGGIAKKDLPFIFDYSYTTVPSSEESNDGGMFAHHTKMSMQNGVGGPMAASYFGGSLDLVSIAGHGSDVFVQLPNISGIATS
ncbi:hypothetical protein HK096_002183, partial [Nowakowskiella sp. JEL0078]